MNQPVFFVAYKQASRVEIDRAAAAGGEEDRGGSSSSAAAPAPAAVAAAGSSVPMPGPPTRHRRTSNG